MNKLTVRQSNRTFTLEPCTDGFILRRGSKPLRWLPANLVKQALTLEAQEVGSKTYVLPEDFSWTEYRLTEEPNNSALRRKEFGVYVS